MDCVVDGLLKGTITGIEGAVRPFVCLDAVDSHCTITACTTTALRPCVFESTPALDFTDAFDSYTTEMDTRLVEFAAERAQAKGGVSLRQLKAAELFDTDGDEELMGRHGPDNEGSDALVRELSMKPVFSPVFSRAEALSSSLVKHIVTDDHGTREPHLETEPERIAPEGVATAGSLPQGLGRLCDKSQASLRARFELLRVFNLLLEPCLPCFDYMDFENSPLAQALCTAKGRLFPVIKTRCGPLKFDSNLRHGAPSPQCAPFLCAVSSSTLVY